MTKISRMQLYLLQRVSLVLYRQTFPYDVAYLSEKRIYVRSSLGKQRSRSHGKILSNSGRE